MVRVKICGITSREDALRAAEAGADALGFIFYAPSPRYVPPGRAAEIVAHLPPFVTPVGVFVNESREKILETVRTVGLRVVQLHGDETPEACGGYPVPVIRALRVDEGFEPETMRAYPVKTFLLDKKKKGLYGGTGETFDWGLARAAKAYGRIVLSGGLGPENVAEAIRTVGPYAVDCGSGVESGPGRKDPEKLAAFFEAIRTSEERTCRSR